MLYTKISEQMLPRLMENIFRNPLFKLIFWFFLGMLVAVSIIKIIQYRMQHEAMQCLGTDRAPDH